MVFRLLVAATLLVALKVRGTSTLPSKFAFCEPQVILGAQALASANAALFENPSAQSRDGKTFSVTAGDDKYGVQTSGGHDCVVRKVWIIKGPTKNP